MITNAIIISSLDRRELGVEVINAIEDYYIKGEYGQGIHPIYCNSLPAKIAAKFSERLNALGYPVGIQPLFYDYNW